MPGSVLAEGDAPAMSRPRKYSEELRERAVRLVFESKRPIAHVARDLGVHKESFANPTSAGSRPCRSRPALPQSYECAGRSVQRADDLVPVLYVLVEYLPH